MKTVAMALLIAALSSGAAKAELYTLEDSTDGYISLNECLYALSKGTRLLRQGEEVFIYNNGVWSIAFTESGGFDCTLVGVLRE